MFDVLFYRDWIYILSQEEEMNFTEEEYVETILIRRINIRSQLDYQAPQSSGGQGSKEASIQQLEFVGRLPSIRISSPNAIFDVDQFVQNYRFALH